MAKASFFQRLEDSRSYNHGRADQFETKTCKAQYDWQLHSFPTCNHLHEREMESLIVRPENKGEPLELVANGYWRDVWILPSSNFDGKHILKTIRYEHDWEERNYDRHRRDALAMERLSSNTYVLNLYAFCGNSGVSEYADGGDISDAIWPHNPKTGRREISTITKLERLHIGEWENMENCRFGFIRLFVNQLAFFSQGSKLPWAWPQCTIVTRKGDLPLRTLTFHLANLCASGTFSSSMTLIELAFFARISQTEVFVALKLVTTPARIAVRKNTCTNPRRKR